MIAVLVRLSRFFPWHLSDIYAFWNIRPATGYTQMGIVAADTYGWESFGWMRAQVARYKEGDYW